MSPLWNKDLRWRWGHAHVDFEHWSEETVEGKGGLSSQYLPVQGPVLNGLCNMGRLYVGTTLQVSNGPGDLQYTRVCPCAETEFLHGPFHERARFRINIAELLDMAAVHPGIDTI